MSLDHRARTLRPLLLNDTAGAPLAIPAGTEVLVVDVDPIGTPLAPFGQWVFSHLGRVFSVPHDALEVLAPAADRDASLERLLDEFLIQEGVLGGTARPAPPGAVPSASPSSWGEPGEERPSFAEINAFLAELELQRTEAGTMSREEFLRRKQVLLDRIRRHKRTEWR